VYANFSKGSPTTREVFFAVARGVVAHCFCSVFSLTVIIVLLTVVVNGQSRRQGQGSSKFPCFPSDFSLHEIVGSPNVTVEKKLVELKARCRGNKLIARNGREIRLYRDACWGNPPADYQDILEKQRKEIAALKKKYTVVEIVCDPRGVVRSFHVYRSFDRSKPFFA
jgi:hypothetical protein